MKATLEFTISWVQTSGAANMPAHPSTPLWSDVPSECQAGAWETRERAALSFSGLLPGPLTLPRGSQAEFEETPSPSATGDFKTGNDTL